MMPALPNGSVGSPDYDSSASSFNNPSTSKKGFDQLNENDVVVVVMGLTGSGKSTFISKLAEQPVQVGDALESCTASIGTFSFRYNENRTVFLIDTPGFDDTSRSDTEILKDIAFFLATIHKQKVRLAGIVYLHRITDPRMQGAALKNLQMLRKICGDRDLASVVLATTMWAQLEMTDEGRKVGHRREQELLRPEFWGELVRNGSRMMRHDGTSTSARAVVAYLVERAGSGSAVLDIQVQMVEQRMTLDETAAGQHLQREVLEARQKYDAELVEYQASMELALREKDAETFEELRREKEALQDQERRRIEDQRRLVVSLEQLTREKGLQYRAYAEALGGRQERQLGASGYTGPAGVGASPTLTRRQSNNAHSQVFPQEREAARPGEVGFRGQTGRTQAVNSPLPARRSRSHHIPSFLSALYRFFSFLEDWGDDTEDEHDEQSY